MNWHRNDWLLKYLYRVTSVANRVAGLEPIDIQHRRMINIDLSEVIGGHGDYLMVLLTLEASIVTLLE